ncbi:hypothetical protein [Pediococcus acidilactici]|uniref:hypothetical protein n=1 Tax=Pediococcus acidilactici TaxID=1254 RepID=UPI001F3E69E5|nr:hypothetical protein [Pediococcus acidilactici]
MRQRSARINRNAGLIALLAVDAAFWLTGESWVTKPISAMQQESAVMTRWQKLVALNVY